MAKKPPPDSADAKATAARPASRPPIMVALDTIPGPDLGFAEGHDGGRVHRVRAGERFRAPDAATASRLKDEGRADTYKPAKAGTPPPQED